MIAFFFSLVILSGTFISLIVNNLNYGIDFKGGILLELRSKNPNQDKRLVWEDMLMAMDFLKMTINPKQKNYFK